jgi:hypothetical protein
MRPIDGIELPKLQGPASPDVELAIGVVNGMIVITFHQPQRALQFKPANAAHIGKHLIDLARELGVKVVINMPRRPVTPEMHKGMIARAQHVIRSTQEQNHNPEYVARAVVESIIKAIDEGNI